MEKDSRVIVKRLKDILTERGTCGLRKRLITNEDFGSVAFSHLQISEAKKHFHRKTTEFYYVLKGKGMLETDDGPVSLSEGTMVMIKPGVGHRAISNGDLEVLIAMIPPYGESKDQYFLQ